MKRFTLACMALAAGLTMVSCDPKPKNDAQEEAALTLSGLNPDNFQTDSTSLYVLKNQNGMEVCFTNFGGRIVSIWVPGKDG